MLAEVGQAAHDGASVLGHNVLDDFIGVRHLVQRTN